MRTLEAEITRGANPPRAPAPPHPDHDEAASRLQELLTKATGSDARARPHRDGYEVILDHAGGEWLMRLLTNAEQSA